MKKIINYRPLFYCFLAFALGIYFAKFLFSVNFVYIAIALVGLIAVSVLCVKFKYYIRLISLVCMFIIGLGAFALTSSFYKGKNFDNDNYLISGRVIVETNYDNYESVIISNVYVDGEKINKNFSVYVYGSTDLDVGDIVTFESEISTYNLFTFNKLNSYYYKYNILYGALTNYADLSVDGFDSLTVSESLRASVKKILDKNMSSEASGVSFASLFGDKTYIEDSVRESFSISGIAHLLAVSGLHVGFLVAFITYILNKFKLNGIVKVCICGAILFGYCYLCSFSVSVMRASLMFLILSFAKLLGKQYDRLNSWSLAGFICLIYKPLSVFDYSFLLSFGSVLCIILFSGSLYKFLEKIKLPSFLCSSLSVMIPVQVGLLPLLSLCVNKFSILSILVNFICIPIFEVFFIMLFIMVTVCLILPFIGFLLKVPDLIISFIILISKIVSDINFLTFGLLTFGGVVVLLTYVMFFICSHFTNLKFNKKCFGCLVICTVMLFVVVGNYIPTNYGSGTVSVINSYNKQIYNIELGGVNFTFGNFNLNSENLTENFLEITNVRKTDNLIYFNDKEVNIEKDYYKNLYLCIDKNEGNLLLGETYNFNDVKLNILQNGLDFAGIILEYNETTILICNDETFNFSTIFEISENYEIDIVLCSKKEEKLCKDNLNAKYIVSGGKYINNLNKNYRINMVGNWTFKINNDTISKIRSLD